MQFSSSIVKANRFVSSWLAFLFVVLLTALAPVSASAFSITDVSVLPGDNVSSTDSVFLEIDIFSGNLDPFLTMPTQLLISGNQIFVDVFISASLLTVPDSLTEEVALGTFSPGGYDFTISLYAGNLPLILQDEFAGSFQVVPLPAALWLLSSALALLGLARRGRA